MNSPQLRQDGYSLLSASLALAMRNGWTVSAAPALRQAYAALIARELPTFPTYTRMTRPDSMAGLPSVSLPAGHDERGLPLGFMLTGRASADRKLLALARAVVPLFAEA